MNGARAALRTVRVGLAVAVAAAVAACGGGSGDLIAIEVRGGAAAGRELDIVVADNGRGTCNGGPAETIPSDLLIEARAVERDLKELAEEGTTLDPAGRARRRYVARTKAGTVRWAEGEQGLPKVLPRTQLLALRLDRALCRP